MPLLPSQLGYRMPAEWEPHRGTWLSWPHKEASWPGRFGLSTGDLRALARHLADHEEVHINVSGTALRSEAVRALDAEGAHQRASFSTTFRPTTPGVAIMARSSSSGDTDGRHESG